MVSVSPAPDLTDAAVPSGFFELFPVLAVEADFWLNVFAVEYIAKCQEGHDGLEM